MIKKHIKFYTLFIGVIVFAIAQDAISETANKETNVISKQCIMSGVMASTMVENKDATNASALNNYKGYVQTMYKFDEKTSNAIIELASGMARMADKLAKENMGNLNKESIHNISMFMCDSASKRKSSPDLLNFLVNNAVKCQNGDQNNLDVCLYTAYKKFAQ